MTEAGFDTKRRYPPAESCGKFEYAYTIDQLREQVRAVGLHPSTATWSAYNSAFNPNVVLSLLDRIEELEASLGKLRAEHLGCEPTKEKATAPPAWRVWLGSHGKAGLPNGRR